MGQGSGCPLHAGTAGWTLRTCARAGALEASASVMSTMCPPFWLRLAWMPRLTAGYACRATKTLVSTGSTHLLCWAASAPWSAPRAACNVVQGYAQWSQQSGSRAGWCAAQGGLTSTTWDGNTAHPRTHSKADVTPELLAWLRKELPEGTAHLEGSRLRGHSPLLAWSMHLCPRRLPAPVAGHGLCGLARRHFTLGKHCRGCACWTRQAGLTGVQVMAPGVSQVNPQTRPATLPHAQFCCCLADTGGLVKSEHQAQGFALTPGILCRRPADPGVRHRPHAAFSSSPVPLGDTGAGLDGTGGRKQGCWRPGPACRRAGG